MGVPFESLIPYVIMLGMFGVSGAGLAGIKNIQNEGKAPRWSTDRWDRQMMARDGRLTGKARGQTDAVDAPPGYELNNPWKLEERYI